MQSGNLLVLAMKNMAVLVTPAAIVLYINTVRSFCFGGGYARGSLQES